MIREGFFEFLKVKAADKDFSWLWKRAFQYFLMRASFAAGRPFCGPMIGTFVANYNCNYRCKMCGLAANEEEIKKKRGKELEAAQLKQLLGEFSSLGISAVGFTGGEPLLRGDIFELLQHSKDSGMITHLNTNGFLLDESTANKLIDIGVDSVNISLDAANPKIHDSIRGCNGAFEAAVKAVGFIDSARRKKSAKMRLKIVSVISEENIGEVEALVGLFADLKADCVEFIPQQDFTSLNAQGEISLSEDFLKKISSAVNFLIESKRKGIKIENSFRFLKLFEKSFRNVKSPITCYAGYNSCIVDCYGEIFPCVPRVYRRTPVGNIREKPLREFWYSGEYNKRRSGISGCRDCYLNCHAELNLLFNWGKLL